VKNKIKVLIIDDDAALVAGLRRNMEFYSYQVISALAGSDGLAKAGKEKPDVILLDIKMPDMDGREVLKKLRDDPATKNIPVIMLTSRREIEEVVKSISGGAVDYLTKPFVFEPAAGLIKASYADIADRNHELVAGQIHKKILEILK